MFDARGHVDECGFMSYLVGDVDDADAERFEQHIGACPECAARLQEEALLEVALFDAVEGKGEVVPPPRQRWERVAVAATAVLGMAAALVLALSDPARWVAVDSSDPPEVALRDASIAGESPTMASDMTTCFPPVTDDAADCDDVVTVALATFPDEPPAVSPFDDPGPMCEDDADSGPVCLDHLDG